MFERLLNEENGKSVVGGLFWRCQYHSAWDLRIRTFIFLLTFAWTQTSQQLAVSVFSRRKINNLRTRLWAPTLYLYRYTSRMNLAWLYTPRPYTYPVVIRLARNVWSPLNQQPRWENIVAISIIRVLFILADRAAERHTIRLWPFSLRFSIWRTCDIFSVLLLHKY